MTVIHKATAQPSPSRDPLEFVMSDDTRDRMGDVIDPKGWQLSNFKRNPMALFNHNSNFPIGHWENVRVEGSKLVGQLKLAAKGTSDRIDEIISLVEQGILRAVSVGFSPLAKRELDDGGIRFTKQELLETSLVSIPANPAAVQLAKSLDISDDTIGLVFGEQARERLAMFGRGISGENAKINPPQKVKHMTIAQQIAERQKTLVDLQDQLATKAAELENTDDTEAVTIAIDELNGQIESSQKQLDALKRAEASLAAQAQRSVVTEQRDEPRADGLPMARWNDRPWAAPAKKVAPFDYIVRSAVISAVAKAQQKHPIDVLKERYGEDRATKATFDIVTRAASAPALTTTTGWALELVTTGFLDLIDTLIPNTVYPGLAARGGKFTFGRNGIVSLPARSTATTIAGSFVGQGAPIPVRQGAFTASTLTVKKMAVITTFSREMAEHSTPAIEAVLRQAIVEDTSVAIDTILLDNTAASAIRPAGLKNGVTGATATAGGGLTAVTTDLTALVTSLITGSNGHLRAPVWIMNPIQVMRLGLITNSAGQFVFANDLQQGRFQGYPVITSSTVTSGTVFLVDAADFFSATGDTPTFNVSDTATLHMEDTTPLAIGTAGSPNTVAAPVRSLFQTDSLAIRMIMELNWAMRRTGTVAFVTSVTW